MMLMEPEIKAAAELVARCEQDLRRFLGVGEIADLIADNRCDDEHEWPLEKVQAMRDRLVAGHGVGAFHMAEQRAKFPWNKVLLSIEPSKHRDW